MITTETLTINGVEHVKHVSDSGYYIQCVETGERYTEAVDPADVTGRTYVETETEIPAEKTNDTTTRDRTRELLSGHQPLSPGRGLEQGQGKLPVPHLQGDTGDELC